MLMLFFNFERKTDMAKRQKKQLNLGIVPDEELWEYIDGKDELNFAEFPVCSVSSHKRKGENIIYFEDTITDSSTGSLVPRRLTITGNPEFGGLPTAVEDEVLLGLIQLTRQQGFKSRTIEFSRYELLKILRWDDGAKSYQRIEEALFRWKAVTLDYKNAWRDKENENWATEAFSVIDNFSLHKADDPKSPKKSSFTWNKVVFRSFKSGNIKSLDFKTYTSLRLPISKRMFRFLDKRFYQRRTWNFELLDFAYNKVGLSRTYGLGQIKQRLAEPLIELEELGFITTLRKEHRYEKVGKGNWLIHFNKGDNGQELMEIKVEEVSELVAKLTGHGVTTKQAKKLVAGNPEDYVRAKIELLEFLLIKQGEGTPKNTGAWLYSAIEDDYDAPKDFKTQAEREQGIRRAEEKREAKAAAVQSRKRREVEKLKDAEEEQRSEEEIQNKVDEFLAGLSTERRETLIEDAYKAARDAGDAWIEHDGNLGKVARTMAVNAKVMDLIG